VATCEDCGGKLRAPDPAQKKIWEDFSKRVSMAGQIPHTIFEMLEDDGKRH